MLGRTLSLPSCARCLDDVRIEVFSSTAKLGWFHAALRDAVADAGPLRHALRGAAWVAIHAGRPWHGTLMGDLGTSGINRLVVTLYAEPLSKEGCDRRAGGPMAVLPCGLLIDAASDPERADAEGFVALVKFPFARAGDSMLVPIGGALSAATGAPPYVLCIARTSTCSTSSNIHGSGSSYHVTLTMAVAFEFDAREVLEPGWMGLFRTATSIAQSIARE